MLNNQNINVKNSFLKQDISQTPTTGLDSQIVDDVLKELDSQDTENVELTKQDEQNQNSQKIIDSLVEEVESIELNEQSHNTPVQAGQGPPLLKPACQTGRAMARQGEGLKEQDISPKINDEKIKTESFNMAKPTSAKGYSVVIEKKIEPLKKAKFEYERLGQPEDEKKIVGAQAIETYLYWVEKSRKFLREDLSDKEKISIFIPKRIQEQLKNGTAPVESVLENKKEPPPVNEKDRILHDRVLRIEEKINDLDEDKPEYPEELLSLGTKKVLMEEEIRNKESNEDLIDDSERLEQERSTQDILNKSSFKNRAPVVQPKKEEVERLKKAQLAEEVDKDEDGKKQGDRLKQEEIATKPTFTTPETLEEEGVAKSSGETKLEITKKQEGANPIYTEEQLHTADKTRKEFWEKLSSINNSKWYQDPSKNRDFVNKQIIQTAEVLSGKVSAEIDMNDIQTTRIFMFNNASQKIIKHPAFSFVESFYNYQRSSGCIGINPEEVFFKQKNTGSEKSSVTERGRSFIEQISAKKNDGDLKALPEITKEDDLLENELLN